MHRKPENRADAGSARVPVSRRSQHGLDWLNFFIADVQTAFGPFVAVYLAYLGWPPGQIGLVLAVGSITSIVSQTPAGALIDAVSPQRLLGGIPLALIAPRPL